MNIQKYATICLLVVSTLSQAEQHAPIHNWGATNKTAETLCLANNIYFEGRGESHSGQLAIGLVTLNRVKDALFPNTVCEVVHQQGMNRNDKLVAQFSWTLDGHSDNPIKTSAVWKRILLLAQALTAEGTLDNFVDITNGATHYHANYINPQWTNLTFIMDIDSHRFYRA